MSSSGTRMTSRHVAERFAVASSRVETSVVGVTPGQKHSTKYVPVVVVIAWSLLATDPAPSQGVERDGGRAVVGRDLRLDGGVEPLCRVWFVRRPDHHVSRGISHPQQLAVGVADHAG